MSEIYEVFISIICGLDMTKGKQDYNDYAQIVMVNEQVYES